MEYAISQPKMVWLPWNKKKPNLSIELQASNVTSGFDLGHELDLWIFKVNCDLDLWPHQWPWLRIFLVIFWNSCISEWESRLTLNKGGGESRSFMTMTIWWPRSGVRIYQIVMGVTSDVGLSSIPLVYVDDVDMPWWCHDMETFSALMFFCTILQWLLSLTN